MLREVDFGLLEAEFLMDKVDAVGVGFAAICWSARSSPLTMSLA